MFAAVILATEIRADRGNVLVEGGLSFFQGGTTWTCHLCWELWEPSSSLSSVLKASGTI